ncbi:hypothetical protein NDU88_004392 [Pleurodeles waltl]|uniref:Uncharacterized protein n=1 Tax=Pleurodeles waltl TaxID=8319 RepID=A0AAV7NKY0_PLEWA|nr:hypothetical protein NDU88_004392 [Pleurodeles waltl]
MPLGEAWFGYAVRCGRMVIGQLGEFRVQSRARGGRAHRCRSVDRLSSLLDQLFQARGIGRVRSGAPPVDSPDDSSHSQAASGVGN